jgi:hypothetical protein
MPDSAPGPAPAGELPPVPYQFIVQPELYHMAVRLYVDSVVARAGEDPGLLGIVGVLQRDAAALKAAKERGEPV